MARLAAYAACLAALLLAVDSAVLASKFLYLKGSFLVM